MKVMASGPIVSWQIDGETMETVTDFIFLGSKITVDGDSSHEIKRLLLLGRKVMTNLDSVLKSRDITLPTKVLIIKAMVFPIVMYGCESWTVKKAGCWRIDAFKLWCWRRLLRLPWTARRSSQLILKEISPEYSLEGLMLKLKLQYFGHLIWGANSLEKTLMLGKIKGRRRRGQQRMIWLDGFTNSMEVNLSKLREMVKNRESWHAAVRGVTKRWTQLSNWRILHFSNCEQLSVPWFATVSDALRPLPMLFFCALNSLPQLPEAYATYCQSLEINSLQRPSLTPSHSLSGLPSTQSYNNICHIVVQMLSSFICIFHQSRSILKPRNALFTSSPPLSNTMHGTY